LSDFWLTHDQFLPYSLVNLVIVSFYNMKRIGLMLVAGLAFASFGLHLAVAQVLVRPQNGQAVVPQSLVPAQPPTLAQPPGFVPAGTTSAAANATSETHPKKAAVNQQAPQVVSGTNQAAKEPEQTKVVRIYNGAGSFDEALAEKLKPMLAKTFVPSKNDRNPISRALPSISANGGPAKDESPRKMAEVAGGL
jgi:hypothetical protein